MIAGLRKLLSSRPSSGSQDWPLPLPSNPVCVIGDVHGMADLLARLLKVIDAQPGADRVLRVFVGDLVDRGPDSARVLDRVWALCASNPQRNICLMGNHERMLLDFLADPTGRGARFLTHGGDATLTSFRVRIAAGQSLVTRLEAQAAALQQALPAGMAEWLAGLPLIWHEGNLAVAHAGADPRRHLNDQDATALLWGHGAFRHTLRSDGVWIAHGHTIVPQPSAEAGRISVDTGAFRTGRLSAAWIDAEGLRFLQVD